MLKKINSVETLQNNLAEMLFTVSMREEGLLSN